MWVGASDLSEEQLRAIQEETRLKEAFAVAYLHWPNDPLEAARTIEPYNNNRAMWIAQEWVNDPYVKAHQKRLVTDMNSLLPTRERLVLEAMKVVNDPYASHSDKHKSIKLCAEIQGFVGTGSNNGVVVNTGASVTNKVMEVPMTLPADQWETFAEKQQKDLTTEYAVVGEK